jgi:hypothetical protein
MARCLTQGFSLCGTRCSYPRIRKKNTSSTPAHSDRKYYCAKGYIHGLNDYCHINQKRRGDTLDAAAQKRLRQALTGEETKHAHYILEALGKYLRQPTAPLSPN